MTATQSSRPPFEAQCPNLHNVRLTITREEMYTSGDRFELACSTCGARWRPSARDHIRLLQYVHRSDW